jgi:hypothetical protein
MNKDLMLADAEEFASSEGLFEDKGSKAGTYLSIFDFTICQRSKTLPENPAGWEGPFTRQNPKTKEEVVSYAKRYDRMVARIVDISKHTKEFDAAKGGGKVTNWDLSLVFQGQLAVLQLVWIDHVLKRFLKVAPNINFSRPVLISAFKAMKNGDPKQAVSFRQCMTVEPDTNVDNWTKVEEYWKPEVAQNGDKIEGAPYVGADGSLLPPPIQDEEDDSWDYKAQNKFLAVYFRDNVLPKIKAIAERYGLENKDSDSTVAGAELTHTGLPQANDAPVTEKPFNAVAQSLNDMVTGAHVARIKTLSQALGYEPNWATQKLVQADLNELTDEAGRYVIYQMESKLQKQPTQALAPQQQAAPVTPPPPVRVPVPAPVTATVPDVEVPWDDPAPSPVASAPAPPPVEDDVDWG